MLDNDMYGGGLEASLDADEAGALEALYEGDPAQSFGGGELDGSMEFKHDIALMGSFDAMDSPSKEMQLPPMREDAGGKPSDVKDILANVERFLLPEQDRKHSWYRGIATSSSTNPDKVSLSPDSRLKEILLQVAIADHIRIFQTMYRDNYDECLLFSDLRCDGSEEGEELSDLKNTLKPVPRLETKALQKKLVEGRIRANALCRLCYGEDSLEMLRGVIDLASAYALQGMWPQVSEHMAIAAQKLIAVIGKAKKADQVGTVLRARDAAAKVVCVYKVLRDHAIQNRGQIKKEVCEELVLALGELPEVHAGPSSDQEAGWSEDPLQYPTQLVALLHGFLVRHAKAQVDKKRMARIRAKSGEHDPFEAEGDGLLTQAFADVDGELRAESEDDGSGVSEAICLPSWGEVVSFLRNDCLLMRQWVDDMEAGLLPQVRAALFLPFKQSDNTHRGACHPAQLSFHLQRSPAAVKALSSTSVIKRLQQLKIEMPMQIDPQEGRVKTIKMHVLSFAENSSRNCAAKSGVGGDTGLSSEQEWDRMSSPKSPAARTTPSSIKGILASKSKTRAADRGGVSAVDKRRTLGEAAMVGMRVDMSSAEYIHDDFTTPTQTVLYELPVMWEELQAMLVEESIDDQVDLLRAQVVTLLGVVHMFGGKIDSAEESMREALKIMERIGLEQEVAACELYNSIAQMMIIKYRTWHSERKERLKKESAKFMAGEKGHAAVKKETEMSRKAYLQRRTEEGHDVLVDPRDVVLTREVREALTERARETVARRFVHEYTSSEVDPTRKAVEAAYRYLVRSYEIISETHGPIHPSSGTACLAVASVLGVTGSHGESREWLVRAVKCFERVEPRPPRAIAFAQQQLSSVLSKEGHNDESMRVLDKAANFYLGKAREGLAVHTEENLGAYVFTPVLKGSALYEDVVMAMSMTTKISRLVNKRGGKWQAAEQAEIVAELADAAFGWDSIASGEAFKEMGNRYAAIKDWQRASTSFKRAQHAFEAANGTDDRKALLCAKSYLKAEDHKKASVKQADAMMREHLGTSDGVLEQAVVDGEGSLNEELGGDLGSTGERSDLTASPQNVSPL